MINLLIIADDFTGGLDTGVQFAAKGIPTRVVTDPEADFARAADGAEVLVVVAETRHIPASQAYDTVFRAVQKGVRLGVPHIYKKTDSGLRGNIGAELSAVMDACGEKALTFLPAMPGIGRITVGGVHYIDGVPAAESVFGKDPFEPVTESSVSRLIALQSAVKTRCAAPDLLPPEGEGILIVDAETEDDLRQAGEQLAAQGRLRLTAGCAGFAAVLPGLLGLGGKGTPALPRLDDGLLVLCGSVNPITQRQLAYAEAYGFTRLHILPRQKLDPDYFALPEGKETLAAWQNASANDPWLILDANDPDDRNPDTAAYAREKGLSLEEMRRRISGALGEILPAMLRCPVPRTLLITGGDTLLQCMNRMNVSQMEPLLEVFPGVVLSRFEAQGQSRFVITKSGGFGEESLLADLKEKIIHQHNDA